MKTLIKAKEIYDQIVSYNQNLEKDLDGYLEFRINLKEEEKLEFDEDGSIISNKKTEILIK